jgi:proteasome lid subunit RPN8/RPN11
MAKLSWRDSDDVYKPISLSLRDFLQEKQQVNQQNHESIEDLYRQIKNNRMNVFVEYESEAQLINHLSIDPYNETGGMLVGQAYLCPDTNNYYTEIIGSIAAPHTVGNRVHFQFTTECWQVILSNQKQYFPRTTIVGWYHSHPGHGIFLSGTDLNTQRLCFKEIWQIAVVYDPLHQDIGYFYGASGKRIESISLQELSQANLLQHNQPQLNWRQSEPQLPRLPSASSVQSSYDSIDSEEEDFRNADTDAQIIDQPVIFNRDQIVIIIVTITIILALAAIISSSQSSQVNPESQPIETQPSEQLPAKPQPSKSSQHLL